MNVFGKPLNETLLKCLDMGEIQGLVLTMFAPICLPIAQLVYSWLSDVSTM